ncbi:18428_t:CDS:2, partial [Dentiscutata erythropus]
MAPRYLPTIVQRKCKEFVNSFIEDHITGLPRKLTHNEEWKESGPELANVTEKILDSLDFTNNAIVNMSLLYSVLLNSSMSTEDSSTWKRVGGQPQNDKEAIQEVLPEISADDDSLVDQPT